MCIKLVIETSLYYDARSEKTSTYLKSQVSLTSEKNDGYLHEDLRTITVISRPLLLRMGNISHKIKNIRNKNKYSSFF